MEKIKFTRLALSGALPAVFHSGQAANSGFIGASGGQVRIYDGQVPTKDEFNSFVSSLDVNNWSTSKGGKTLFAVSIPSGASVVNVTNNTVKINDTAYAAAVASGTATWFVYLGQVGTPSISFVNAFMGTISDAAGNGDMKLTSTDIVQGQQYRVNAVNLMIPYEFEF